MRVLAVIAATSILLGARAEDKLAEGFANPPESTKPWVYWYWLSGHISKEGITKDLEAMAAAGIGRACIGDISRPDIAWGPVPDLSEEYFGMLEHAVAEGQRLGVKISLFNCPGWSQNGGPWVKPGQAMRYLVSTDTQVSGPRIFDGKLPLPELFGKPDKPDVKDLMQDVATFAFPVPRGEGDLFSLHHPQVRCEGALGDVASWSDGKPETMAGFAFPFEKNKSLTIDFTTEAPFTARSLVMRLPSRLAQMDRYKAGGFDADVELFAENADGSLQSVRKFEYRRSNIGESIGPMPRGPVVVNIPETTTKHFRLVLSNITANKEVKETYLSEIEFSGAVRLDDVIGQQLGKMCAAVQPPWNYYMWTAQAEPADASYCIDPAKVIDLTRLVAPDGTLKWEVPAGDWMITRTLMRPTGVMNHPASKTAQGLEADKMSESAIADHYRAYVGKLAERIPVDQRGAFDGMVIDSYETGSQNWTDDAPEKFRAEFGYDPLPWLPVLSGRLIGTADQSTRFLWDLRRFVADRIAATYASFRDLGLRDGIKLWMEPYGHWGFPGDYLQLAAVADGVGGEFWINPKHGQAEVRAVASGAHISGKTIISSEAFTGTPSYGFTQDPWTLKGLGDYQQTDGINHFVLHVYIHQAYEKPPGMNSWFGTEFNRHNTWFGFAKPWIHYLRRSHFLLQQGHFVADVAYFNGEDAPKMGGYREPALPPGYSADDMSAEAIFQMTVRDGKLVLPDGMSYRLLVLPPLDSMRPAVLAKIRDLVAQGGPILGDPPKKSPSLQDFPKADEKVRALAKELWGGEGRVFRGVGVDEALKRLQVPPDVIGLDAVGPLWSELEGPIVPWIHRTTPSAEIYYLSNQADHETSVTPSFRVDGMQPELWDPVTGTHRALPQFTQADGRTSVPLNFAPRESYFVIFRGPPLELKGANFPAFKTVGEIIAPWTVRFDPALGGPAKVVFDQLVDWTKRPEEGIAHYSGVAIYENEFERPEGGRIFLNLGALSSMARVKLNGQDVGVVWCKPYRLDVTKALRDGKNTMQIEVVNTWINRLLADEKLPPEKRVTWVASKAVRSQKALPAGLFGPVTFESAQD